MSTNEHVLQKSAVSVRWSLTLIKRHVAAVTGASTNKYETFAANTVVNANTALCKLINSRIYFVITICK